MRRPAVTTVLLAAMSFPLMSCGGGGKSSMFAKAPLQGDMSFSYHYTAEAGGGKLDSDIALKFKKREDGAFDCTETLTDKDGSRDQEPFKVDGFFKHDGGVDTLAESAPLWRDPKILASGHIGRMKVVPDTYNGKSVYACLIADYKKEYYDQETGLLEGFKTDTGEATETLVRVK